MADNNTRRRVREISESSECEENSADNANESLTQCESEAGVLSQSATGEQDADIASAELSESFDTCNNEDLSEETDDGVVNDGNEEGSEDVSDHSETEHSDTDHASDHDTEHDEREGVRNDELSEDEKTVDEDSDDDIAWQNEQRHSGDGEEQNATVKEKTDIDEDRTNPAFIPRKGYFYEHDLRLDEKDEEKPDAKMSEPKKKLWVESLRRWDHDHYDERAQAPKSRAELISAYGYDIRLGSSPPTTPPSTRKKRNNPKQRGSRNLGDFMKSDQRPSRPVDTEIHDTVAHSRRPSNRGNSDIKQSDQAEDLGEQTSIVNDRHIEDRHDFENSRRAENYRDGNRMNRYSQMRQQRSTATGDQRELKRNNQGSGGHQRSFGESRQRFDIRSDEESRRTRYDYGGAGDYKKTSPNDFVSHKSSRQFSGRGRDGHRLSGDNALHLSRNNYNVNPQVNNRKSADWDDDRLAVVSDAMPHTKNVEKQRVRNEVTIEFNSNTRNQKLSGTQHHQTRTISNTNYRNAADVDLRGRDRKAELSGIVAAMSKVSVSNDSRPRAASSRSSATAASNDVGSGDFIPPVTSTYTRTSAPPASSMNVSSFDQLPSSHEISKAATHLPAPPSGSFPVSPHQQYQYQQPVAGKPKRYSTQRQRNQPDVGDSAEVAAVSEVAPAVAMSSVSAGYALPPRLQRSKYHDEEDVHHSVMTYPQRALVATGPPQGNVNYSMSGMPVQPYYPAPEQAAPATSSPPSLMHAAHYIGAPPHMMPGPPPPSAQYYPTQAVYGYAPPHHPQSPFMPPPQQYRMAIPPQPIRQFIPPGSAPSPQIMTEVSPSMEVRGGTVYFNAETQQPELRVGGIYYGPAGQQGPSAAALTVHRPSSAIPIINPQEAASASASETAQYFPDSAVVTSYPPQYSNYVPSPMPRENTPVVTPSQENSAESAVA